MIAHWHSLRLKQTEMNDNQNVENPEIFFSLSVVKIAKMFCVSVPDCHLVGNISCATVCDSLQLD